MILFNPFRLASKIFPRSLFFYPTRSRDLYLTFDDGPHPEITPWVLDLLDEFKAKATFFCVGQNIERFPEIFKEIIRRGHAVGNHTFSHVKSWQVEDEEFFDDIEKCQELHDFKLFRPPYGKVRPRQQKWINERFQQVLWDVIPFDFHPNTSEERCLEIVRNNAKRGSIIVFHDSDKAKKNLKFALPEVLKIFSKKGYGFRAISKLRRYSHSFY